MTSIEWTDATWNPVRGCSMAPGSETGGCLNCYAARQAARNLPGMRSTTGRPYATMESVGPRWTGQVEEILEKLYEPLQWKNPRRVFVNSMSDLFHEKLEDGVIDSVFATMAVANRHTFQILTKRPGRMRDWMRAVADDHAAERVHQLAWELRPGDYEGWESRPWPLPNVWLGVSVENQATADERIPLLLQTPAAVRFVSYEPALAPVDFRYLQPNDPPVEIDALNGTHGVLRPHGGKSERLDWLIVGGESGPGARPFDLAWGRSAVAQCKAAGVPVFVKQLGAKIVGRDCEHGREGKSCSTVDRKGGDPSEWPEDMRVREFPPSSRSEAA